VRPSEDTRSHTLAALRRGYVSGRLQTDTFSFRVERALSADSSRELRELAADLPHRRWRDRLRALRLPARARQSDVWLADPALLEAARLTLGRAPDCGLVFGDDTVSRHHARLELRDGRWFLVDLDSSNGTLVNGRRVRDTEVRAGDEIRLGAAGFTL
jgi:pSer/pThr/pTyr-binding forkhead associated (FHA) protein